MIVAVARRAAQRCVVLTGGCFQNRFLTEQAVKTARGSGLRDIQTSAHSAHDGGIAFGQAAAAAWNLEHDEM